MAVTNPFQQINASLPPLAPAPQLERDPSLDNAQLPLENDQQQFPVGNRPQVFAAPKQTPQDRQETMLGGRLEKDYQKDLHPWGTPENHPGVWGKIGHALSYATGGPNRRLMEESGIEGKLNKLAALQSEDSLRGAQAGNLESETADRPAKDESEENLQGAETEHTRQETSNLQNPQDTNPDMATYRSLIKLGMAPREALQEIEKDKAMALKPPTGEHVNLTVNGKPAMGTYHPDTGKTTDSGGAEIPNPVPYERPQVTNVNAGNAELDRESTRLAKPYQTGFDAAGKQLDNIDKTVRSIDSGYKGQALALPETLTSLVSGQGTGVRVTMPELQMVGQHNGIKGDIESFFNRIGGEGSMTEEDKKQLKGVLTEARQILQVKQQIHQNALDSINGAGTREDIVKADKTARQQLTEYEQHGFYTGQKLPQGTVVGFSSDGKVRIDDGR